MVLSEGRKSKTSSTYDKEILDQEMIQMLQDAFCIADQVYCVCVNRGKEPVTVTPGSAEEQEWIKEYLNSEGHTEFWCKLLEDGKETIVERETNCSYIKLCGLAIRFSDKTKAVWIVLGILRERLTQENQLPSYLMTTTESRYDKSLKLLETISRQYFSAKLGELMWRKEFRSVRNVLDSLNAILENVGCGIYVCDPANHEILYTNPSYQEFFQSEEQRKGLMKLLKGGSVYTEFYSKEDSRWFDIHSSKIHWVDGREVMLYTIYEVTDKKLYQQKIEKQANNDFLTGLYNRMRCEYDLQYFIKQTKEKGGQGALLYIDLDDFKHINDGLGHQYGDVLLQSISHSLQSISGIESTCYRMGGDEFIVIVTHANYDMLENILDEIRRVFMQPWFLKGANYYCTMSMGIVRFPLDGDKVEELIRKADIAMYEAKRTGKNRIEYYDESAESTSFERLDLESKMRNATMDACRDFTVYFQPIMGVDGECQGAEALIRWKSDGMGLISPSEFIPLAEYLGLINPIGDFVLEEACRHLKYWNDRGHINYQVNVNLSVVQLLQNDIVSKIKEVIEETGIIAKNLVLEVTESLAVNDMNRMKMILAEIKKLGVRVALDDFGTGYSSLNHIREMPLDIIKIDRCFIVDIGKDAFSESFVKMVAELAATIGVLVCVEGVETKEQYEALLGMRIQQIQGFYYDKPMSAELFEQKYV